jgi:hypothetical protein
MKIEQFLGRDQKLFFIWLRVAFYNQFTTKKKKKAFMDGFF